MLLASWATTGAAPASGPLWVHRQNPRYFDDGSGRAICLTGQHTWANLQDGHNEKPFDFEAYLDFLQRNGHNFMRLWRMEYCTDDSQSGHVIEPQPYARTGPGTAPDGKPKFDLEQLNPAYFERLRTRVKAAGDRGIYVSVMLFEGVYSQTGSRWTGHLFNAAFNVNQINGDSNGDGNGFEVQTLDNPAIVAVQKAYVRKVIDAVDDMDNVLYEISNESPFTPANTAWQYEMIRYVKEYEAAKPRQHPVGMTCQGDSRSNDGMFASPADWISPGAPGGYDDDPPAADGKKVIISDTDHLGWVISVPFVWKCFTRGIHVIEMDHKHSGAMDKGDFTDHDYDKAMGHVRRLAERMNLAAIIPRNDLASSTYCLANPGQEYLAYLPDGGEVTIDLTAATGQLSIEWIHPTEGTITRTEPVAGGDKRVLKAPFNGEAVAHLWTSAMTGPMRAMERDKH